MRWALTLAALLFPASVFGARKTTPTAKPPAFVGQDLCECAKSNRCWNLVLTGFGESITSRLNEIEAALPNRFFPRSIAMALAQTDSQGNFLSVRCGANRSPCDDQRDELEKRVIYASFLASIPPQSSQDRYFDPETWAVTDKGELVVKKAKRCRPGLMAELGRRLSQRQRKTAGGE